MSTSLRLSDEAVNIAPYSISEEAIAALRAGDSEALLRSHRGRWADLQMMADEDDEDSDDDNDDDSGDGDDDDDDDDDSDDDEDEDSPEGKKSKAGKDSVEGLKAKVSALEDEKNRLFRGRQKARDRVDELEAEVQRLKKDAPGDDDLKNQIKDLEKQVETSGGALQEARLQIAFLSDNTYEWVNPGQALKLADLSEVEIDDDGKVHGMKSALEALATDSPHLLKPKRQPRSTPAGGSTGDKPKSTSAKKKAEAERERIRKKYVRR